MFPLHDPTGFQLEIKTMDWSDNTEEAVALTSHCNGILWIWENGDILQLGETVPLEYSDASKLTGRQQL